jgi:hypothetical protein
MNLKDILYPARILNNLLRDYAENKLLKQGQVRVLYEATVIDVDHVGGKLSDNPVNPKNSIRARVKFLNAYTDVPDLPIFWPIFPHEHNPIKPSEKVYVIFEDEKRRNGLWLARIPEPQYVDNVNLVPGKDRYLKAPDSDVSELDAQRASEDIDDPDLEAIDIDAKAPDFVAETVPPFTARVGDHVLHGSNNAMIVLGRDRPKDVPSGEKEKAGTIDLVVGRKDNEHMNLKDDASRIYISQKTDADKGFDIKVGSSAGTAASIAIKSDEIRVVGRKGMKIVVEGGDLHIEASKIFIGKDADQKMVLGDKLVGELEKALDLLTTPPIGLLGQVPVPMNPTTLAQLKQIRASLKQLVLSQKSKVK